MSARIVPPRWLASQSARPYRPALWRRPSSRNPRHRRRGHEACAGRYGRQALRSQCRPLPRRRMLPRRSRMLRPSRTLPRRSRMPHPRRTYRLRQWPSFRPKRRPQAGLRGRLLRRCFKRRRRSSRSTPCRSRQARRSGCWGCPPESLSYLLCVPCTGSSAARRPPRR